MERDNCGSRKKYTPINTKVSKYVNKKYIIKEAFN
jgi:hypothetical protein